MKPEADLFFECSWEVCNKVGGIYTVVSSKALSMMDQYGEKFILVGPYKKENISGAFEEHEAPGYLKAAFQEMAAQGIHCTFGTWLIRGGPQTILVDFSEFASRKDKIKEQLWNDYKIDSLGTDYFDFDETIIWGSAVGLLVDAVAKNNSGKKIVSQFHEWLSGAGVLQLKKLGSSVKTVFTTHATVLGRSIAGSMDDLYGRLEHIDPEAEAKRYGVLPKFQVERASADAAHVFTTVSEITGIEATHLLGRKPDVLLPNGLDMRKFPTFEEASINHKLYKTKFYDFISGFFFPYEQFDISNTLIFFLAGRYEMHTKGIDVYIDALAQLNARLKEEQSERTVVAFIWVPTKTRNVRNDVMINKANYDDIHDTVEDQHEDILHRIMQTVIKGHDIDNETVFPGDDAQSLKRLVNRFRKDGAAPLTTHVLEYEDRDAILQKLRAAQLLNRQEDKVKVIYYPVYLTGADGLLDTNYYQSLTAGHLGVFPSYYEPWGYTPLEAGALGVPSVTTDLSGFGKYVQGKIAKKDPGIYVIPRHGKPYHEVVSGLVDVFTSMCKMSKQDRIENKIRARSIANLADWKFLGENYIKAHNEALKR